MIFAPSVGPGYDDTRVRPWNGENVASRAGGAYYNQSFAAAIRAVAAAGRGLVSITSFNEWHEGTQIETAVARPRYERYSGAPDQYLHLTRRWVRRFVEERPALHKVD